MNKPSFVYVTYIATTPEKVWQAFIDTDVMAQYWRGPNSQCSRVNKSDWKPGSRWVHERTDGSGEIDIVGKVIEADPPRRLVYSWARPAEENETEKHSRVAIDIEALSGGLVKLTVAHEDLEKDPKMLEGVSGGWPAVLSNLKTLLETGRTLPKAGQAVQQDAPLKQQ